MRLLHSARWMFLALLLSLVPASAFAGVFISVGFAPPVLPVYEQPPCPEPGLVWTPGYWAYGPDGYYWVPGAWVPAPYEGALWTPGYWGWSDNLYLWHAGYWGRHVGYYGGVNYGFGYMGVGFAGGLWRGHDFVYNTAVVRVDNVHVRNVYVDRTIVQRNTIVNDRHVAFSGGPGGIARTFNIVGKTRCIRSVAADDVDSIRSRCVRIEGRLIGTRAVGQCHSIRSRCTSSRRG